MASLKEEIEKDLFVEVMFILLVIGILVLLWSKILESIFSVRLLADWFLQYLWPVLVVLGAILSILALIGIVYNLRKLSEIVAKEHKIYGLTPEEEPLEGTIEKNDKWERVLVNANSNNQNDWRQAIIEADAMLDEVLRVEGYFGGSVGEMLKGISKSDLLTLENAWDAHKVRNEIAHTGSNFQLNERETKRVVALYESVFRELKLI